MKIAGFFSERQSRRPRFGVPLLLTFLVTACLGSPPAATSLEDLEIGNSATLADLPQIPLGKASFHPSDPASVSLASGKVQLVEFFAYWCTTCKAMAPSVHGLENIYKDQINFVYLDREDDATKTLRDQLGYIYQPHFFLLAADGSVLGEWRGYVEAEVLQQAIVDALQ